MGGFPFLVTVGIRRERFFSMCKYLEVRLRWECSSSCLSLGCLAGDVVIVLRTHQEQQCFRMEVKGTADFLGATGGGQGKQDEELDAKA